MMSDEQREIYFNYIFELWLASTRSEEDDSHWSVIQESIAIVKSSPTKLRIPKSVRTAAFQFKNRFEKQIVVRTLQSVAHAPWKLTPSLTKQVQKSRTHSSRASIRNSTRERELRERRKSEWKKSWRRNIHCFHFSQHSWHDIFLL